ncbi:MAG: FAD binding domain-containing protein [Betaproteobacteria bacterium]|jgi:CO/xanthine dehydrogenase FAD-binding subunit|nr:FAD binding domain-containing protein [Betaproteobacteria bacterium]
MSRYFRPQSLDEALRALSSAGLNILAGGTDFYPARVGSTVDEDILDITALDELRGLQETEQGFRIGALTTWSDIITAKLPAYFDCLKLAARELGGVQIQNAATIVGNICNASPAADGVPPLLSLGAEVEVARADSRRIVPLDQFITGNRRTGREPGELVTAIHVPRWSASARSHFLKLGARKYLVISIAMVSGVVEPDAEGVIARCGFAVGSCSAVAQRLSDLERALTGEALGGELSARVGPAHLAMLAPLTDVRGTADYRVDAALALVRRTIRVLAGE